MSDGEKPGKQPASDSSIRGSGGGGLSDGPGAGSCVRRLDLARVQELHDRTVAVVKQAARSGRFESYGEPVKGTGDLEGYYVQRTIFRPIVTREELEAAERNPPAASQRRPHAIIADVKGCKRCGGSHEGLTFALLTHPHYCNAFETMRYWAPCPVNGEPIMMGSVDDQAQLSEVTDAE